MTKTYFVWGVLLATGMASCRQEGVPAQVNEADAAVQVKASVWGNNMGRTVTQEDGSVSFSEGDRIGFFMPEDDGARLFVYTGGEWVTEEETVWPTLSDDYTFHAFYPYEEGADITEIPMPDLTAQTGTLADIGDYDFLSATKTCGYTDAHGVVEFVNDDAFTHVYALLLVTLKDEGDGNRLTSVSVEGTGCFTAHAYRFTDGVGGMFKPSGTEETDRWTLAVAEDEEASDASRQVAVLLNPSSSEVQLTLTVNYTRQTVAFMASTDAISHAFEGGFCYKYQIRIDQEDKLVIDGHEVTSWIEGEVTENDILVEGIPQ